MLTRAQQETQDNTLLTDNQNFENTPTRHKTANKNLRDNAPNFADDNFSIDATDKSHKYSTDPTTNWNTDPTHALKLPPKKWIDDNFISGQVVAQNIAYVDVNGDDNTAEVGNFYRPFATIQSAINAVPITNSKVVVLGGTYTEVLNIAKTNFYLDLKGVTLNGAISINSNDITIDLRGGAIDSTENYNIRSVNVANENITILGGVYSNTNTPGQCFAAIKNSRIIGAKGNLSVVIMSSVDDCIFVNCDLKGGAGVFRSVGNRFYNCELESTSSFSFDAVVCTPSTSATNPNKFYDCKLKTVASMKGESFSGFNNHFYNCSIENNSGEALLLNGASNSVKFEGCVLSGSTDCVNVNFSAGTARNLGKDNIFKDCVMYAGTGEIFNEVGYGVADNGEILAINCTFNKAQATNTKVVEHNTFVRTDLQEIL